MGLAILEIVFYHAPMTYGPWGNLLHSCLNSGVDIFLFLSGIGACYSLPANGTLGYLKKRARRLLPQLYPVLIVWSLIMWLRGVMTGTDVLGSISLLGWWFGQDLQLNWYFSAVWLYYILAAPAYTLIRKYPVPGWIALVLISLIIGICFPFDHLMVAVARLPVFFTGILFGVLEQQNTQKQWLLRLLCGISAAFGLWLLIPVWWGGLGASYGYLLGLWWYPYALFIPGLCILLSDIHHYLTRLLPWRFLRELFVCAGNASAEILMVHVAVYKFIFTWRSFSQERWYGIMLICLLAGIVYRTVLLSILHRSKNLLSRKYSENKD